MLRKLYLFILCAFVIFILLLNITTFLTDFNVRQLTNIFYVPERSVAAMMLFEHIVFESGIVLQSVSDKEVEQAIHEACQNRSIDPMLVAFMIQHGGSSPYAINTDGSIGLMRVKSYMLENTFQTNLFTVTDNIKTGVEYMAMLMQQNYGLKNALMHYYAPSARMFFPGDVLNMQALSEKIYYEYDKFIRGSATEAIPSMLQDETAGLSASRIS